MSVRNAVCCVVSMAVQNAVCCVVSLSVRNAVRCVVSLAVRLCAVYHCQSGTLCAVLYHWRSGTLWPSGTLGLALPSGQAGSHSLEMVFCCRCCCCCFPFHYPAREFLTAARTYFRNLTICPTLGCHLGNCHCCFCCPGSLLSSV